MASSNSGFIIKHIANNVHCFYISNRFSNGYLRIGFYPYSLTLIRILDLSNLGYRILHTLKLLIIPGQKSLLSLSFLVSLLFLHYLLSEVLSSISESFPFSSQPIPVGSTLCINSCAEIIPC